MTWFYFPQNQWAQLDTFGQPYHGELEVYTWDRVRQNTDPLVVDRSTLLLSRDYFTKLSTEFLTNDSIPSSFDATIFRPDPTLALPNRNAQQQATDLANGHEWLNYTLLSKDSVYLRQDTIRRWRRDFLLYGNDRWQDEWLYGDPLGQTWKIRLVNAYTNEGALIYRDDNRAVLPLRLAMERFGILRLTSAQVRFGSLHYSSSLYNDPTALPIAEKHYYAISVIDAGVDDFDSLDSTRVWIIDTTSNGSKILLILGDTPSELCPTFTPSSLDGWAKTASNVPIFDEDDDHNINAVYEIVLSGVPGITDVMDPNMFAATVRVEATQQECSGTVVRNSVQSTRRIISSSTYLADSISGDINPSVFSRPHLVTNPSSNTRDRGIAGVSSSPSLCTYSFDCLGNERNTDAGFNTSTNGWSHWEYRLRDEDKYYPEWRRGPTYGVGESVTNKGKSYICLISHIADPVNKPGEGASWETYWEYHFTTVSNTGTVHSAVWFQGGEYEEGDIRQVTEQGIGTGFPAYLCYVSTHFGTNDNKPSVGPLWMTFWKPGILGGDTDQSWFVGRVCQDRTAFSHDFVLIHTATIDGITFDYPFKCFVSHIAEASNEPGIGTEWPQYWVIDWRNTTDWRGPVFYAAGEQVKYTDTTDKVTIYEARVSHQSDNDTPPSRPDRWQELFISDCDINLGGFRQTAYHWWVFLGTKNIDVEIQDAVCWVNYRSDETVKRYYVSVEYFLDLNNDTWDSCWGDTALRFHEGSSVTAVGNVDRSGDYSERLEFRFTTDDMPIPKTIVIEASASAVGHEDWTETYETYPVTWNGTGVWQAEYKIDGVIYGSVSGNIDQNSPGMVKENDDTQNFVAGQTFGVLDNRWMERYSERILARVNKALPGGNLHFWMGGAANVPVLGGNIDAQFSGHDRRSNTQVAEGDPLPQLRVVVYSPKLLAPMMYGGAAHPGLPSYIYGSILLPDDFPWRQYGVYAPDVEETSTIVLTQAQPIGNISVITAGTDWGDDVNCVYDPVRNIIIRNRQRRTFII